MPFKLSKAKEYAILYLHEQKVKPEEISKELNIALSTVDTVLKENIPDNNKNNSHIITKTSHKKNSNVAIMTQEGSLRGESLGQAKSAPKRRSGIFKPKG